MKSVIAQARSSDVQHSPFPYIVIDNALPADDYAALEDQYPFESRIDGYSGYANNTRYQISAVDGLRESRVSPLWKEFIALHTSRAFYDEVRTLFAADIARYYPHLKSDPVTGVRFKDASADVWLDCQPGMNSPVREVTSVKGPHIDHQNELYAGLLYFRQPQDTSIGGNLEVYKVRQGSHAHFYGARMIRDADVEKVASVEYAPNRLVLFLNSLDSIHGVSPRGLTAYTRRLVNIIGEVDGAPLFSIPSGSNVLSRARQLVRSIISG